MNNITADLINEAEQRLAEHRPDLKLTATLDLGAVPARALSEALDEILIPALMASVDEAASEGRDTSRMMFMLNEICGVSLSLGAEMENVVKGLQEAWDELAARQEDEEVAEIKRQMGRSE